VAEGHGWFLRRYDQQRAIQFLNFISELSTLTIQAFGSDDIDRTSALVKKFADQKVTLADAHGLSLMQQRSIRSCWSTDRHLALLGVPLVISLTN
jgi:predicted nucleic acid-binding protein